MCDEVIVGYLTTLFDTVPCSVDSGVYKTIDDKSIKAVVLSNARRDKLVLESYVFWVW